MISTTDNEATRTIFVRTRPALHEDEDEPEAVCYTAEAETENFGLEANVWPRGHVGVIFFCEKKKSMKYARKMQGVSESDW